MSLPVFQRISLLFLFLLVPALSGCGGDAADRSSADGSVSPTDNPGVVNVYSHRHYDTDKELFARFSEETGIAVHVVEGKADELIHRLQSEGEDSPADLLITVDVGRLHRAKEKGLLRSVQSSTLEKNVPRRLRDADNSWFGLTKRARVILYSKERVDPTSLSTYENLTDPMWKGKVLIRSSGNIYNQSLLASMIATQGAEKAKVWAEGMVANFARSPKGNDRDQIKGVAAGLGDLCVANTYYMGKLLDSTNPEEREAAEKVGIFYPNQKDRGAHVNVSGAGVAAHAKNEENAIRLLEFLSSTTAQKLYAEVNHELPVNPAVGGSDLVHASSDFVEDSVDLTLLGTHNADAVKIFDEVGWR